MITVIVLQLIIFCKVKILEIIALLISQILLSTCHESHFSEKKMLEVKIKKYTENKVLSHVWNRFQDGGTSNKSSLLL